jgi:hypothetical protein
MPRAEEVLIWAGLDVKGGRLPVDRDIQTTCRICHHVQMLGDATFTEGPDESVYMCGNGCQPLLIISPPGEVPWPGRGYRLGDWIFRNPDDLILFFRTTEGRMPMSPMLIPASPHALAPETEAPEN